MIRDIMRTLSMVIDLSVHGATSFKSNISVYCKKLGSMFTTECVSNTAASNVCLRVQSW